MTSVMMENVILNTVNRVLVMLAIVVTVLLNSPSLRVWILPVVAVLLLIRLLLLRFVGIPNPTMSIRAIQFAQTLDRETANTLRETLWLSQVFASLAVMIAIAVYVFDCIGRLAYLFHREAQSAHYFVTTGYNVYSLASAIVALALSLCLFDWLFRRLTIKQRQLCEEYARHVSRSERHREIRIACVTVTLVCAIVCSMYTYSFAAIVDDGILVGRPLSLTKHHYSWSSVKDVETIKNGKGIKYRIHFCDGVVWTSDDIRDNNTGGKIRSAIEYIKRKLIT